VLVGRIMGVNEWRSRAYAWVASGGGDAARVVSVNTSDMEVLHTIVHLEGLYSCLFSVSTAVGVLRMCRLTWAGSSIYRP
jgi:hypothetical protein